jgi:hypothetical protein
MAAHARLRREDLVRGVPQQVTDGSIDVVQPADMDDTRLPRAGLGTGGHQGLGQRSDKLRLFDGPAGEGSEGVDRVKQLPLPRGGGNPVGKPVRIDHVRCALADFVMVSIPYLPALHEPVPS